MIAVRFHDAARSELAEEVLHYAEIDRRLGERLFQAVERAVAAGRGVPRNGFPIQVRNPPCFPGRSRSRSSTCINAARSMCSRWHLSVASQATGGRADMGDDTAVDTNGLAAGLTPRGGSCAAPSIDDVAAETPTLRAAGARSSCPRGSGWPSAPCSSGRSRPPVAGRWRWSPARRPPHR